jgi:hypothetical protein
MKLMGLVVVGVTACAGVQHVDVAPLPPNPTPDQRMWAWETYRPRGDLVEVITRCGRGGCSTTSNKVVAFADGRLVRDPEDLTPLVAQDSRTAVEAHRATHQLHRGQTWALVGAGMLVGGFVVAMKGNQNDDSTEQDIGIGVMVGGLIAACAGSWIIRTDVREARDTALTWYPHDLADQLRVCFNGTAVVPCEMNVPGTAVPAPRDPNLDQLRPR